MVRLSDKIAYLSADIDDALRGGVLYPLDIPAELVQTLGSTHSERLNTFITDIIMESRGKGKILQSDRIREAQSQLNSFMFSSVYLNSIAKVEEGKAQQLVYRLFEYYIKHPERLGDEYQDIWKKEGRERAVCDYIAGMTDAYAVETYEDLFIPKSWAVK